MSAQKRWRLIGEYYQPTLKRCIALLELETQGLLKILDTRSIITGKIEAFYDDFSEKVTDKLSAPLFELSEEMAVLAAKEINIKHGSALVEAELAEFHRILTEISADYVTSSRNQLIFLSQAYDEGQVGIEAVKKGLGEWLYEHKRAKQLTVQSTNLTGNIIARVTWEINGVEKLKWRCHRDSCSFCRTLNGKVVAIDKPFLLKGDKIDIEGEKPMKFFKSFLVPPIHRGCKCTIEPV